MPFFFVSLPIGAFAAGANRNEYVKLLANKAENKNLAWEKEWRILLHYKKTLFGGYTSEAFDRRFFNAPNGRTNPEAELEATLNKLFLDPLELKKDEEHPQCLFPARLEWLKKRLDIKEEMLPAVSCHRLERWLKSLDPDSVTMVFASYFMNSPASMFGHTLLRLDKLDSKARRTLLNYGVNYAGAVDTENMFVLAFKGVFGLFRGEFSIFPYYRKVQEYSDLEARDLWEYELNLTKGQVRNLMLHLWEVGGINFRYFYFRENCSYEILALLEAGNPQLRLTEKFRFSTIPSDTIKALYDNNGLVARKVYRPSILSRMNHKRSYFGKKERDVFNSFLKGEEAIESGEYDALSTRGKALVLDAYLDYTQYINMKKRKSEEDYLLKSSRGILLKRARLDYKGVEGEMLPLSSSPEEGHESSRAALGIGGNDNGLFQRISLRPAYHDLLQDDRGFAKNSQIIYFEANLRHYNKTGKTVLESLKLVDVASLAPYDPMFSSASWKVGFGFRSLKYVGCEECPAFNAFYARGYSWKPSASSPLLVYGLLKAEGDAGSVLTNGYRAGAGPNAGALLEFSDKWKTHLEGTSIRFAVGRVSYRHEFRLSQRYSINKNLNVVLDLARVIDETDKRIMADNEWLVSLNYFF